MNLKQRIAEEANNLGFSAFGVLRRITIRSAITGIYDGSNRDIRPI